MITKYNVALQRCKELLKKGKIDYLVASDIFPEMRGFNSAEEYLNSFEKKTEIKHPRKKKAESLYGLAVGDKVLIHCGKNHSGVQFFYENKVGEITDIWENNKFGEFCVRLPNGCNNTFFARELTKQFSNSPILDKQ